MHFEDHFTVKAPLPTTWKFVTTPDDFVKIIPDLTKYKKISDDDFETAFKMGLGMIKGTMNMRFKFSGKTPLNSVRLVGKGTGPQLAADISITLNLTEEGDSTNVRWTADVIITGVAASIGSRLIESTTKSKVNEMILGIKSKLESRQRKSV
jgi:carbon monoxide dehydrogenase subunit G